MSGENLVRDIKFRIRHTMLPVRDLERTIDFWSFRVSSGHPQDLVVSTLKVDRKGSWLIARGHLTTVLATVKGSLAWLGGFAALDACCAPWCTAAMR